MLCIPWTPCTYAYAPVQNVRPQFVLFRQRRDVSSITWRQADYVAYLEHVHRAVVHLIEGFAFLDLLHHLLTKVHELCLLDIMLEFYEQHPLLCYTPTYRSRISISVTLLNRYVSISGTNCRLPRPYWLLRFD